MAIREGTTPPADLTLFVDGVNQNDKPPLTWLNQQVLEENFPFSVPAGFQVGQGVMQWTNNDELNHRIELVSNNSDIILLAYDNPTVIELDNTPMHIGVCLSHTEAESISCSGATDKVKFISSGLSSNNTGYNLIVNGFNYRDFNWSGDSSLVGYLQHAVLNYLSDKLIVTTEGSGFGTDWTIQNISNENLRISLVPWISTTDFSIAPDNENPTLHSPNSQVFEFCLSPGAQVDPPWDIEYQYIGETTRELTGSEIPDYSNFGNVYATSLKFNNTVIRIGDSAFKDWSYALSLELSNTVKNIGNGAFSSWIRATTLIIPEGVETIGSECFDHWLVLKTLTLPSSITSISTAAFNYCSALEKITVNAINPPNMTGAAFWDTNNAPIYVPQQSVNEYKAAPNWSNYSSRIFPIP